MEQEVKGGVPTTRLTPSEIVTYYGAIVGSNSEGDLYTWNGESNIIEIFDAKSNGSWDYSSYISEDLAGRDLEYVMTWVAENI